MEVEMGMNIKSERAHLLAKQLAQLTGRSLTAVIEDALQEKLSREHKERDIEVRRAQLREILDKSGPTPRGLTSDHSDLYDEIGLPK
jgi:antitoxin VapB